MDPISLPEKIACKSQSIPRYSLFRSRESLTQYPVAAHVVSPGFSEAGEPCRRNRRFQTGSWWLSIPSNFSPLKFPPSRTEILREGWGNGLPAGAVGNGRDGRRMGGAAPRRTQMRSSSVSTRPWPCRERIPRAMFLLDRLSARRNVPEEELSSRRRRAGSTTRHRIDDYFLFY
jgi:hypothetical protein